MITAALITIAKIRKPKYPSMNEWMDKEDVVYMYNGILHSHEKEGNLAICNNLDGSWGHYAEWDKSDRERQIFYDVNFMWNLKKPNS